jgi:hypothetical protein
VTLRASGLGAILMLAACGNAAVQSSAASLPPAPVSEAFCGFLEERTLLATDEVGAAFHAAQTGDLDDAIAVSTDTVLPVLVAMTERLDAIEAWAPARAFATHARGLVDEFSDAIEAFLADPTESTFARVDVAGQALRDDALSGEFAQVGTELFDADCG